MIVVHCFLFLLFSQDFQGFLNDLQDWELSLKDKDKKMKPQASNNEISVIWINKFYCFSAIQIRNAMRSQKVSSSGKTGSTGEYRKPAGKTSISDYSTGSSGPYDYPRSYDAINNVSSGFISEDDLPDAASEKVLVGVATLFSCGYYWKIIFRLILILSLLLVSQLTG